MILYLLFLLLILLYIYFKYQHTYWMRNGVPQLDPIFPFGDMASVIFRRQNMAERIAQIYKSCKTNGHKYIGLYFFSRKVFLPIDRHLIKKILMTDFPHFNDRGIYYDEENDPLSAHLFSLAGPKWKTLRAKITPTFTPGKLRFMFGTILGCGREMIAFLQKSQTVEIKDLLARFTTDVIGNCAFGIHCNTMSDENAEFRRMGRRAFTQTAGDVLKMIIIRSFPNLAKFLRLGVFAPQVTTFFQQVVRETIQYREEHNVTRQDFLQLLIQLKNDQFEAGSDHLSLDEIGAQAFIFFLAGFETTSTTIMFCLYEMALNRKIQDSARFEVCAMLQKYGGDLTYDALMEMSYLESIILEALRKYPPAPIFLRKCTKTYQVPGTDCIIEKGFSVLIPAFGLHRDEALFEKPEEFNPVRFDGQNRALIKDSSYIPFGDGPRNCIGMRFSMMQIKIALALILARFQFELNTKRTKVPLKMEPKGIILTPVGGIWLDLTPIPAT